jgi:hypothetical protein
MRHPLAAIAIGLTFLIQPSVARSDWPVINNLDEPFTVIVWPQSDKSQLSRKRIGAGQQAQLKLFDDNHFVQLISGGGDVYTLQPTSLQDRGPTTLKTILTPNGRRNGRINYNYMNQRGYKKGNNANDIRDLGRSMWQTKFVLPGGDDLAARIEFRGDRGLYRTTSYVGELLNLRFSSGRNQGETQIDGDWKKGELRGPFEFQISADQLQLTGRWTQDRTQWRPWTGKRDDR